MTEVVGSINRVASIVGEISLASAEQSSGVAQVGEAVGHMDQATQQNAALVEQSAAAAASLKQRARELVEAVGVFTHAKQDFPQTSLPSQRTAEVRLANHRTLENRGRHAQGTKYVSFT